VDRPGRPVRVLLACSGLEHAQRGYESFARECFEALRDDPRLDLWLVKGSGPAREREKAIPSLKRDGIVARLAARDALGRLKVEQYAFGIGLQPEILRPYMPHAELIGPGSQVAPGWYAVSALVEQFVPAILRAEPGALSHEGLRGLALGYRPIWRRIRQGEDHGWVAGTFHLYRVRAPAEGAAARQR